MRMSDMPSPNSSVMVITFMLTLAIGCGDEYEEFWSEDIDGQAVVETVQHELTPMWGNRSAPKKYTRKRHQIHRENRARNLDNRHVSQTQGEGIHWVRETGFRAGDESEDNETDFVRETGFMPAPRLTLVSVSDGTAHLSWTSIADVGYYILNGRVVDLQRGRIEQHGTSYILRGNEMSIDLEGRTWQFRVTAVGNNKSFRSKASNRVQADPNGE